jgi:hypothetical protein
MTRKAVATVAKHFEHLLHRAGTILYRKKVHCKKRLSIFPSPAGMSLTKLSLVGNNLIFQARERVWLVT